MKNTIRIIAILAVVAIIAAGAYLGYIFFSGGSGEPSTDIEAATIPLEVADNGAAEAAEITGDNRDAGDSSAEENNGSEAGQRTLFRISTEGTQASFTLHEVLRGAPNTVLGTTDQVGGEILVDFNNPQNTRLGIIRINSRNLETDQSMRNRMLRSRILLSSQDQYEFIDFEPSNLIGLPQSVEIGGTYNFQIVGNLTIIGQTNEVTFDATVTLDSATQISGTVSSTILYADYGISIPRVPLVASVGDQVELNLAFVAQALE